MESINVVKSSKGGGYYLYASNKTWVVGEDFHVITDLNNQT